MKVRAVTKIVPSATRSGKFALSSSGICKFFSIADPSLMLSDDETATLRLI
jgi:hypothetical protein